MCIDGCRSGARPKAKTPGGLPVLPARCLSGCRARAGGAQGRGPQAARRPRPPAARRRAAQARGQGLRLRARAAVRHLPAHAEPPSEDPARGGDRGLRAARAVGLLLRPAGRAEGADRMAELSENTDIREIVRERYAAAATRIAEGAGCGCGTSDGTSSCCDTVDADMRTTDADGVEVYGAALYGDEAAGATGAAV